MAISGITATPPGFPSVPTGQAAVPVVTESPSKCPEDCLTLSKVARGAGNVAKTAGKVVTGTTGAVTGAAAGLAYQAVTTPFSVAHSLSKGHSGLVGGGLTVIGFAGGLIAAPFTAIIGGFYGGYVGAHTGADLVEKAVHPQQVNLKERFAEHRDKADEKIAVVLGKAVGLDRIME